MLNSINREYCYYEKFYDEILNKVENIKSIENIDKSLKKLQDTLLNDKCNIVSVINEYKKIYNSEYNEYKKKLGYCKNSIPDDLNHLFNDYKLNWKDIKQILKLSGVRDELFNLTYDGSHRICPVCGLPIGRDIKNRDDVTMEHILPKSMYMEYLFYIDNLIPLCRYCNEKKADNYVSGVIYNPFFTNQKIDIEKYIEIYINPKDVNYLSYNISSDADEFIIDHFNLYKLGSKYREYIFYESIINNNFKTIRDKINTLDDLEEISEMVHYQLEFMSMNIEEYGNDFYIIKKMTICKLIENIDSFTEFLLGYD